MLRSYKSTLLDSSARPILSNSLIRKRYKLSDEITCNNTREIIDNEYGKNYSMHTNKTPQTSIHILTKQSN